MSAARLSVQEYKAGILQGDRFTLAKAITLVESSLPRDQDIAMQLLDSLLSYTGKALRIGITGVPGVGKSTFIEAFGELVIQEGKRLAVLTIDPSSRVTKGSILGDKTRMENLSRNSSAFVRPSPAGETLGGIASKTKEVMLLCEAAGFDVLLVETVGVGQSEVSVKNMVDFFLLLMLAGAGDELQGIKKGIIELADALVITKADGENVKRAREAQADYQHAIHLQPMSSTGWTPQVLTCSAITKEGIDQVWRLIQQHETQTKGTGHFFSNRNQQDIAWFNNQFENLLKSRFEQSRELRLLRLELAQAVNTKTLSPHHAAHQLVSAFEQELARRAAGQ